MVAWYLHGNS